MQKTPTLFKDLRPRSPGDFWTYPDDCELFRLVRRLKAAGPPRLSIYHGGFSLGKTSMARYVGKYASCVHHVNELPCGNCKACRHLDTFDRGKRCVFYEFDPTEDDFYEQLHKAVFETPLHGFTNTCEIYEYGPQPEVGVIFIDEAHRLTPKTQDRLLKPIEDSDGYSFILATTQIDKIDGGLLSRAGGSVYHFAQPTRDQVAQHLKRLVVRMGGSIDEAVAYAVADKSKCEPRTCLGNLDDMFCISKNITPEVWRELYGTPIEEHVGGNVEVNW